MTTGLEPLIAKGGAAASMRAVGWAGTQVRNRVSDKRMRKALSEHPDSNVHEIERMVESLGADLKQALLRFLNSPELEHCLLQLATERALLACETRAAKHQVQSTRQEFDENLRLALGTWNDKVRELSASLFQLCDDAVTAEVHALLTSETGIDPRARARLVRVASQVSTASIRNTEILTKLADLDEIMTFESDLRTAVRNLHSTMRLPHAGTSRQVPFERLFVAPAVSPIANEPAGSSDEPEFDIDDLDEEDSPLEVTDFMSTCSRTVLLGNPGAGKSTSSLKLVYDVAAGKADGLPQTVPFLISLKNYADRFADNRPSVLDYLYSLCEAPYSVRAPESSIEYLLLNGRGFVIFDGLDELLDTSLRREIVSVVEGFAHRYPLTPILVTSRVVGYEETPLDIELFTAVRLEDFNDDQVEAYARRWFSLDEAVETERRQRIVEAFLEDSHFVSDLRVNPLMLSLMCGIYASENYIPRNRPDVYEKCALLLFDRWDRQRGINAPLSFDAHVQAAMRSLALWLYPQQESQTGLPRSDLIAYMTNYLREKRFDNQEDAEDAASQFIDFCKGRAWVLTEVGADLYGFTHRTFLEYFAASQLVRMHHSSETLLDELWTQLGGAQWDVVAQLSLQMLGRTVEDGSDDFLLLLVERTAQLSDPDREFNYLSFAVRALQFVVPRPPVLQRIVADAIGFSARRDDLKVSRAERWHGAAPVGSLIEVTSENRELVAKYARDAVVDLMARRETEEVAYLFASNPVAFSAATGRSGVQDSERRRYWIEWARQNRTLFEEQATDLSVRYHWIAAERVRAGLMSVDEFVARFGVRGLFDFYQAGRIIDPPIAYDIARGRSREELLSDSVVAGVLESLLESPTPWIAPDPHYLEVYSMLGFQRGLVSTDKDPDAQTRRAAMIVCRMVILEIRNSFDESREGMPRDRILRPLMRRASADSSQDAAAVEPVEISDLIEDARVLDLLERWLSEEVSLVGGERSGVVVPVVGDEL